MAQVKPVAVTGVSTGAVVGANIDANFDECYAEDIALGGRITTLEGNYIDRTYDYVQVASFTVANDTYETVAQLVTPSRGAGTYELKMSMIHSLNSVTTSAFFRFSTDGGSTWTEVRKEPKDNTDNVVDTLIHVDVFAGGIKDIVVQARKENAGDVLLVTHLDIIYQRVV